MNNDNHVANVRARLLSVIKSITERENCSLNNAVGQVLAAPVRAPRDLPSADISLLDGYAFEGPVAAGQTLTVDGVAYAGDAPQPLKPGTAMRIFTGGLLPKGADTVVAQECVQAKDGHIIFNDALSAGSAVRLQGADTQANTILLPEGHRICARDVGLIASTGIATVPVVRKVRVALLTTGDELLAPGEQWSPGKIYDANGPLLEALLAQTPVEIVYRARLADQRDAIKTALSQSSQADLILTSGGVSVGQADLVREVVSEIGQLDHWRVFLKPGKPLAIGRIEHTPFLGLPGNPVSTFVTFLLFAYPAIAKMAGQEQAGMPHGYSVGLAEPVNGGDRPEFIRVQYQAESNTVVPFSDQNSGLLSSLSWADGLAYIPEQARLAAGDFVTFYAFNDWGL